MARRQRFTRPMPVLRLLVAALAAVAIFFVIRTGHLGAQLTWERGGEGPPQGFRPPGG
jgi:hypothetical protein